MRSNIIGVLLVLFIFCGWYFVTNNHNKHIGEKYISGKDTLTITNWDAKHWCYDLSNGAKVSCKLIN